MKTETVPVFQGPSIMLADILGVVVMVLLVTLSQLRESIPSLVEAEIASRTEARESLQVEDEPIALFVGRDGIRDVSGVYLDTFELDQLLQDTVSQDRTVALCIRSDIPWSETAPLLRDRLGPPLAGRTILNTDISCWPF